MPRTIPAQRFAQLIDVATRTFVARGYRLTQMSDVATALGVAKGTLYGYVQSKDALFDAAVRFADGQCTMPDPSVLPLATPATGSTLAYIQDRLMRETRELELLAVLSKPDSTSTIADEFESIIRDLFRRMWKNRRALKLVDRCAIDQPKLATVWFEQARYGQVGLLTSYLERRIGEGRLRRLGNVPLAARMVLETVALWAIHMPWDPSPRPYPADEVENTVVDMLVHAYVEKTFR